MGKKENKCGVWLAIARERREIVGVHLGNRRRESAQALWRTLPTTGGSVRSFITDFWEVYETVIAAKRHRHG